MHIQQNIEIHSPLALVILMLGTNDFQSMHQFTPWHSAQGIAALVNAIRQAPIEPGMSIPPILIVVPPPIGDPKGPIAPKFMGGAQKCLKLAAAYQEIAKEMDCFCFDAGSITSSSQIDGVHLDQNQHQRLGLAISKIVSKTLDL